MSRSGRGGGGRGELRISKAIASPPLPTSLENGDLHHLQSLRLTTRVNRSCKKWLSQHHDALSSCGSASLPGRTIPGSALPVPQRWGGGSSRLPGRLDFSQDLPTFFRAILIFVPFLPLLGAGRLPWVALHLQILPKEAILLQFSQKELEGAPLFVSAELVESKEIAEPRFPT